MTGRFHIQPQRGGVWRGVAYSPQRIVIQPDAQGRWSVVLPPSSVVGPYTVKMARHRFSIVVPEAESANFAELVE